MMHDDPSVLIRKAAYLEQVHDLHRLTRRVAMASVVAGFVLLIWARLQAGAPPQIGWAAYGLLAFGWLVFIYVVIQKSRYLRSHPFDPDA